MGELIIGKKNGKEHRVHAHTEVDGSTEMSAIQLHKRTQKLTEGVRYRKAEFGFVVWKLSEAFNLCVSIYYKNMQMGGKHDAVLQLN